VICKIPETILVIPGRIFNDFADSGKDFADLGQNLLGFDGKTFFEDVEVLLEQYR